MRGYLAGRITEMADRVLIVGHSGIVQHDHVGRAAARALVVIRRRPDLCDDGGFGTQFGCNHTRTVFAGAESEFWARTNGSPRRRPLTGGSKLSPYLRYVTYALNTTLLSPSHMRADFNGPPAALSAPLVAVPCPWLETHQGRRSCVPAACNTGSRARV